MTMKQNVTSSARRGTPDFLLLLLTFLLTGFGLVMVFSASSVIALEQTGNAFYYAKRQAIFAVAGTVGMFVLMNIPIGKLKPLLRPLFLTVLVMLALVPFFGTEGKGARSWFYIGSFGIQPTEFAKVAVILYLAALITKKGEKIRDFKRGLMPSVIIVGVVAGLIMLQPDLGSCFILVLSALLVIIIGGANLLHIFAAVAGVLAFSGIFIVAYLFTADSFGYRMARISCFLNPWSDPQGACYQIVQSMYAFGHGELAGSGIGKSIQKLHYLPEPHNDFIFAIIGEELGFIGSIIFVLVYLTFLWRGLVIAVKCPDPFGNLAGIGIVGMIGIQAFVNMGGVTGTIPLTGVTLPLISYGGSSLLATMCGVGILLGISRLNNRTEKEKRRAAKSSM